MENLNSFLSVIACKSDNCVFSMILAKYIINITSYEK
jgi:hypothetical protein